MKFYLGLGSNLDRREENIDRAVAMIHQEVGTVTARSRNYTSRAVGFQSLHLFVNAAVEIETSLSPEAVLQQTTDIERRLGKNLRPSRSTPYADRIIDIDLLLAPGLIHRSDRLILPHPHLHERDFVLLPLLEIASDVLHPLLCLSIAELTSRLTSLPDFVSSVFPG